MELLVDGCDDATARRCEGAVLAEIDRLALILSTRDPSSHISQVMRGDSKERVPELEALLAAYASWSLATGGALDLNLAGVRELWRAAEGSGRVPTDAELAAAHALPMAWNVDALGKAFIIDRAVELARTIAPSGLLNIGGDIRAWGERTWRVGVADPSRGDNAEPIAMIDLKESALATSGGAMRHGVVAGRSVSHLVDPRSLQPIGRVAHSATIHAEDCVTANALATAACVLGAEAFAIVDCVASGALVVDGEQVVAQQGAFQRTSSSRPRLLEAPATAPGDTVEANGKEPADPDTKAPPAQAASTEPWPKDFEVSIGVAITTPADMSRYRRPYVAVWIEDQNQKIVRNIVIWGADKKWHRHLTTWFRMNKANPEAAALAVSISSASRKPGSYNVTWDGRDDAGQMVPRGTYVVRVEVSRERGGHTRSAVPIVCGDAAIQANVEATKETDASVIRFGPRKAD